MFRSKIAKAQPNTPLPWTDPPPSSLPAPLPPSLHPVTVMFFDSSLLLGVKAALLGAVALSAMLLALGWNTEEIFRMNLWLVAATFGLLALSGAQQMLALNLKAFYAIAQAWRELRANKDLNGSGGIGDVQWQATPAETERVIDLVRSSGGKRSVIESGKTRIDKRDFLQFLHRAWDSNGIEEQGCARLYWLGGPKKDGAAQAQYEFTREDGSKQLCTRELYDGMMNKLRSLGEIEGGQPGISGRLKRDPKLWLVETQWL